MQRRIVGWLAWVGVLTATACAPAPIERPKLVVLIGIDQFRADYLERYDAALTGGFRRLKDHGRYYPGATVEHAPTLSYPGHTTLATGSHPKTHGITSNAWVETLADGRKRRVSAARDPSVEILGEPDSPGLSPRQIRVTGLADWIRDAHRDAHAVALSTGPALAMLYGGKALEHEARNHAYWLSGSSGRFVTSSYHRTTYPDWVQRFNDEILPRFQEQVEWTSTVPETARRLARRDLARYEGDGVHTTFPHRFESDAAEDDRARERYPWEADPGAFYTWFFNSPFADEALFALAKEAVLALQLGQDGATDLLAIAIKSMDRIGHDYGPRSQEQLDIFVRLDRLLAGLLDFLDETVGEDHYIVAVSADHVRITEELIRELVDHVDRLVTAYDGPAEQLASRIARELEQFDIVARAMTPDELAGTEPADEILRYYRNSFIPGRSTPFPLWTREVLMGQVANSHPANFGIVVEYVEQGQLWTARSAHGTSYRYDREVPILLMGPGIPAARVTEPARTIDLAPTLAHLAGIPHAETVDGRVLQVSNRDR